MISHFATFFIWIISILSITLAANAEDKEFLITVYGSNHKDWVKRNLDSILTQSYDAFQLIYIDDASSDGTRQIVENYIQDHPLKERISLITRDVKTGTLPSLCEAIEGCPPDKVVVALEGCDWLSHREVLEEINQIYQDPLIWLTYGQTRKYPLYSYPRDLPEPSAIHSPFIPFPCLKTFYAKLFQAISEKDLKGSEPISTDLFLLIPLMEIADHRTFRIQDAHLIYNTIAPRSSYSFPEQSLSHREPHSSAPKKVYITPGYWGELFSIDNPIYNRDNCLEVLYRLREIARSGNYDILQANSLESLEDFEYLIVFDVFLDQLETLSRYPKEKKILFLWEPPSVIPENYNLENHRDFARVYTWHDALVDNKKYFKFFYPVLHRRIKDLPSYNHKKLCTLIACNKISSFPGELYSKRRDLIQFHEKHPGGDFTLYGKWWPEHLRNYAGSIETKVDTLKNFRFCYAYENIQNIPGYITEKIFDCFQAGTIPIYWGAPNICSYIPKNCYISREDFPNEESLYSFIKEMNETRYQEYQKNIELFLESPEAALYSQEHFISSFMQLILLPSSPG